MNRTKYNHKEAFCLMEYQDKVTGNIEVIWNSRDGVTPFIVTSRDGNESQHVNWQNDLCRPNYKPAPGERIFVDATKELMQPKAIEYVEKFWEHPITPMSQHPAFTTKEAAIDKFTRDWSAPGNPAIVVVK